MVWLLCACWYETSVRKTAQTPSRNIHTRTASLLCACDARGYHVPRAMRMHARSACIWKAFLRCADGCVSVEWKKQWRPWHSAGTCRVSHHCVLACVCWGWMTERSVCHTLCTGEGGVSRAHEECESEGDPACQRSGYTLCMGTSGLLDQHSACILGAGHGNICRQTLYHTFHTRNCQTHLQWFQLNINIWIMLQMKFKRIRFLL